MKMMLGRRGAGGWLAAGEMDCVCPAVKRPKAAAASKRQPGRGKHMCFIANLDSGKFDVFEAILFLHGLASFS
jgi:hypothetical protein